MWKEKRIEEIKKFGYLEYRMQKNGDQKTQVRERVAKAAAVMGQIWGIRKKRFGKDWRKRI